MQTQKGGVKLSRNYPSQTQLLPGEFWTLKESDSDIQNQISDTEINEKYNKGEIRIITEQARYSLPSIPDMLKTERYELNPEYQRRRRWNNIRKSRLIESLIINVPIPPIFLYETEFSKYEVMDGLQRLSTINDFYNGKFELSGLTEWKELNGRTYKTLPEQIKRGIDRRYLSSIILLTETAKDTNQAHYLKQVVFERLNSGGEKLTPQETRNALYNGTFNRLCVELAKNNLFRAMWQLPLEEEIENLINKNDEEIQDDDEVDVTIPKLNAYRKMEDVEMVLRFFAYRHLDKLSSPLDAFLDEYLRIANNFPQETQDDLKPIFVRTIDLIYSIFGKKAFLPPEGVSKRMLPLKIIYDPMMQAFSQFIDHKEVLLNQQELIRQNIYDSQNLPHKFFQGRDNTKKDAQNRIKYFHDFLAKYV